MSYLTRVRDAWTNKQNVHEKMENIHEETHEYHHLNRAAARANAELAGALFNTIRPAWRLIYDFETHIGDPLNGKRLLTFCGNEIDREEHEANKDQDLPRCADCVAMTDAEDWEQAR